MKSLNCTLILVLIISLYSCNETSKKSALTANTKDTSTSCMMVPARFGNASADSSLQFNGDTSVKGMVLIKGGDFMMGGDNSQASADEYPKHEVKVNSFWMDATVVTNAEFAKFVNATHYITTAEKNRIGMK